MLNDDFCLGYSILGNMIVQQGSVLFKQDQIPLGFIFFFDIYFYQILICMLLRLEVLFYRMYAAM